MIQTFRHKGLARLYHEDDRRRLPADDVPKIRRVLARLERSSVPSDMDVPGFRLHALKGDLKGFWAIAIRANWRIVFRMEGGDAFEVDFIDYH